MNDFFSHTGSDGSSAGGRISLQGYPWRTCGENIAVVYPAVSSVIQGWLGSEGHCRNLMDPDFTEIGAGYATDKTVPATPVLRLPKAPRQKREGPAVTAGPSLSAGEFGVAFRSFGT